jgi:hypothetical protein
MCDWGSVSMSDSRQWTDPIRWVSVIMGTVVGLTFLFGFGNVLNLALRLGVAPWIAPLIAPSLDLSILGLLLATRHLALGGVPMHQLRPARRLLVFASLVTLALNVADPLISGHIGRALFDAVGPLLLIGWAEVGPGLLQAIRAVSDQADHGEPEQDLRYRTGQSTDGSSGPASACRAPVTPITEKEDLLVLARHEDKEHWDHHRRPISAETLRKRLRVGAERSRALVATIRAERGALLADTDQVARVPT